MDAFDKFKNVNTASLIRGAQEHAQTLIKAREDKTHRTVAMQRTLTAYREVVGEALTRLKSIDRSTPDFFPDRVLVEYRNRREMAVSFDFDVRDLGPPTRNGIVVGRTEKNLLVQLDGDDYRVEVDPLKLKIRFLRNSFV